MERKPKVNDEVNVVLHDGKPHPAKITAVNDRTDAKRGTVAGTVDLEFNHANCSVITNSPFDPTGVKPDSWHFPTEVEKKAEGEKKEPEKKEPAAPVK